LYRERLILFRVLVRSLSFLTERKLFSISHYQYQPLFFFLSTSDIDNCKIGYQYRFRTSYIYDCSQKYWIYYVSTAVYARLTYHHLSSSSIIRSPGRKSWAIQFHRKWSKKMYSNSPLSTFVYFYCFDDDPLLKGSKENLFLSFR